MKSKVFGNVEMNNDNINIESIVFGINNMNFGIADMNGDMIFLIVLFWIIFLIQLIVWCIFLCPYTMDWEHVMGVCVEQFLSIDCCGVDIMWGLDGILVIIGMYITQ